MKYETYDRIVGQVQARAALGSREAAVSAIRSVLTTLGERVLATQAHQLAAQLPRELGVFLERTDGGATRFGLDELLRRIGAREGVPTALALEHARVVLAVVRDAVALSAIEPLRGALSSEERVALFEETPMELRVPR